MFIFKKELFSVHTNSKGRTQVLAVSRYNFNEMQMNIFNECTQ